MSSHFTTTLRFNLNNEEDCEALAYLQGRDRKRYRSYSSAVISAVNDYFSRQERLADDPFLETRERQEAFLLEVKDTIRESMKSSEVGLGALAALIQSVQPVQTVQKENTAMSEEAFDTAMDFMSGL